MTLPDAIRSRQTRWHELVCAACGAPFCWRNRRRKRCLDCAEEAIVEQLGYSEDVCFFCKGPDAGYEMLADDKKFHDACEECVRKRIEEKK